MSILTRSTKPKTFSRRTVLKAGALGLSGLALSQAAFAQTIQGYDPPDDADDFLLPEPPVVNSVTQTYPLINRMTFGATPSEIDLFKKKGWNAYIEYHLAPQSINESALTGLLKEFPSVDCTPYQGVKVFTWNNGFDIYYDMASAQLVRATYAKAQLREVMTEFWLDHFNVSINAIWGAFLPSYIATIRANAFTTFEKMLFAVAKSGAMLQYLDNVRNERGYHNENYARELMELHTLGVYAGYTEQDIYVARRCFTGWNFRGYYQWPWEQTTDPLWGTFQFYDDKHDFEGGFFLGTTPADLILKGGLDQGEGILKKLARHPSTALYLSRKLCRKFLGESVSEEFVQSTANIYTSSGGDIKTILRHILKQDNFTANYTPKFKRPFQYVASSFRATNAAIVDTGDILWWMLEAMRQRPFQWSAPNGYPDAYLKWVDNLLPRLKAGAGIAQNNFWGVRTNPFPFITARTPTAVVTYINNYLFMGGLSTSAQTALKDYMRPTNPSNQEIRETIGLALSSPEFMWY